MSTSGGGPPSGFTSNPWAAQMRRPPQRANGSAAINNNTGSSAHNNNNSGKPASYNPWEPQNNNSPRGEPQKNNNSRGSELQSFSSQRTKTDTKPDRILSPVKTFTPSEVRNPFKSSSDANSNTSDSSADKSSSRFLSVTNMRNKFEVSPSSSPGQSPKISPALLRKNQDSPRASPGRNRKTLDSPRSSPTLERQGRDSPQSKPDILRKKPDMPKSSSPISQKGPDSPKTKPAILRKKPESSSTNQTKVTSPQTTPVQTLDSPKSNPRAPRASNYEVPVIRIQPRVSLSTTVALDPAGPPSPDQTQNYVDPVPAPHHDDVLLPTRVRRGSSDSSSGSDQSDDDDAVFAPPERPQRFAPSPRASTTLPSPVVSTTLPSDHATRERTDDNAVLMAKVPAPKPRKPRRMPSTGLNDGPGPRAATSPRIPGPETDQADNTNNNIMGHDKVGRDSSSGLDDGYFILTQEPPSDGGNHSNQGGNHSNQGGNHGGTLSQDSFLHTSTQNIRRHPPGSISPSPGRRQAAVFASDVDPDSQQPDAMDLKPPSPCGRKPLKCRPPPLPSDDNSNFTYPASVGHSPGVYSPGGAFQGPSYPPPPVPGSRQDPLQKSVPPRDPATIDRRRLPGSLPHQDSVDHLGAPPPPPRGRARSPAPRLREENVAMETDGGRLAPDTVVPAPLSPTSPHTQPLSGRHRLKLDVPVATSMVFSQHHEDDDMPTSPAPAPPYATIPSTYNPRPSYIDPHTIASVPAVTPRKMSLQGATSGSQLGQQVSVDPFPELGSKQTRPGGHNSYLDLLSDPDDPAPLAAPENDYYSFLEDEPLYQVYHRDAVAREIVHQADDPATEKDLESEDYLYMDAATVQTYVTNILTRDADYGTIADVRQSSLQDVIKLGAGTRKMWAEMPEVKNSGCLDRMSSDSKKLQESLFEVITSEASYVKSLNLLLSHFYNSAVLDANSIQFSVISKQDHHVLFSNVTDVRKISSRFLQKLEALWHADCILDPTVLADTMREFAHKHFDVYVMYVKNQMYQERTLKKLRDTSSDFERTLAQLETDPSAQGLTLQSFLVLPMQRITRLPLLIDSICHRMQPNQPGYEALTTCLNTLQKIVRQCNESARQMENIEQVNNISKTIDFKATKTIPLVSSQRSLVKQGQLTHVITNTSAKLFSRKKETLHLFLFNDLLLITKKKGPDQYEVREYTSRIHIHADLIQPIDSARFCPQGVPSGCKNLLIMVLTEKDVQYVLAAETMSERMRWVEAVTPPQHTNEDEKIYEDWDCPQVQAVQRYVAKQPDELSLEESDVINVHKKMADGWYNGERIRDGEKGWFPSECTVEIQSAHVRAKNLRQHYRMLLAMATDDNQA